MTLSYVQVLATLYRGARSWVVSALDRRHPGRKVAIKAYVKSQLPAGCAEKVRAHHLPQHACPDLFSKKNNVFLTHAASPNCVQTSRQIKREVDILSEIRHPHIVRFIGWSSDFANIHLVTELGERGDLIDVASALIHMFEYILRIIQCLTHTHFDRAVSGSMSAREDGCYQGAPTRLPSPLSSSDVTRQYARTLVAPRACVRYTHKAVAVAETGGLPITARA